MEHPARGEHVENVIIIGSGPAGLTAAIYAARANLEPLVFEGLQPGGQLTITTEVENYPGFPEGIEGPELMEIWRKQAQRFGSRNEYAYVDSVDLSQRPFTVTVGKEVHKTHTLILATGASARWLGIEGEETYKGRGLSACATCDGFFFKDKELLIVGAGDSAMEEAIFLTRFASKVTVVHRREEFRASKIMEARARAHDKIHWMLNKKIVAYLGDDSGAIHGATLEDTRTGERMDVACGGIFLAIGHTPNTGFLEGQIDLDESGYIELTGYTTTNVDGVFACGDVADTVYRQAVTAAGTGCAAAIDAERWIEAQGFDL